MQQGEIHKAPNHSLHPATNKCRLWLLASRRAASGGGLAENTFGWPCKQIEARQRITKDAHTKQEKFTIDGKEWGGLVPFHL